MNAPEFAFYLIQVPVVPIWAAWIFAPRSSLAQYFAKARWPWLVLSAMYVALILWSMFAIGGKPGASMTSLRGVMIIFDSEWTVVAAWMHYIVFDSFAARWIMNDAEPSWRLSPILALTCFFGPAGLLLYLATRQR